MFPAQGDTLFEGVSTCGMDFADSILLNAAFSPQNAADSESEPLTVPGMDLVPNAFLIQGVDDEALLPERLVSLSYINSEEDETQAILGNVVGLAPLDTYNAIPKESFVFEEPVDYSQPAVLDPYQVAPQLTEILPPPTFEANNFMPSLQSSSSAVTPLPDSKHEALFCPTFISDMSASQELFSLDENQTTYSDSVSGYVPSLDLDDDSDMDIPIAIFGIKKQIAKKRKPANIVRKRASQRSGTFKQGFGKSVPREHTCEVSGIARQQCYKKCTKKKTAPIIISQEEKAAILRESKPKMSRKKATFEKATPSQFCHICARQKKVTRHMVCGNIREGFCRKVICERCFIGNGWDWDAAESSGHAWKCNHCSGTCPKRSQCGTYQRTNDKLRENRILKQHMQPEKRRRVAAATKSIAKRNKIACTSVPLTLSVSPHTNNTEILNAIASIPGPALPFGPVAPAANVESPSALHAVEAENTNMLFFDDDFLM